MPASVTDSVAIETVNQYFDDLIALADPEAVLPLLRPQVEAFRYEALNHPGLLSTLNRLRGFLWGLVVAGVLSRGQGRDLSQRLDAGRHAGWL
ncbi:hypothetical protein [Pseudomonas putida]|uniref:hypothetical protein n=1 Tax=Pseudomonas putida TaxID=303 RepID=UPI003D97F954